MKWNRSLIIAELKRCRREGLDLSYKAMHRRHSRLVQASEVHLGSYKAAICAAGFDYEQIRHSKVWTRDQVLQKLKEIHQRGDDLSPGYMSSTKGKKAVYLAALAYCGSYRAALRAAKIDYRTVYRPRNRVWPVERVLGLIRQYHEQNRDLSMNVMRRSGRTEALVSAGARHFGSWGAAIEAAGIDYLTVRKPHWSTKYSAEMVIDRIRKMHAAGKGIRSTDLKRWDHKLYYGAKKHFGSHAAALTKAGIDYRQISEHRKWTRNEIVAEVRALHEAGVYMSSRALCATHPKLVAAAARMFGKWSLALEAAGLTPMARTWTRQEVIADLQKLHQEGVYMSNSSLRRTHSILVAAADRIFGNWTNALKAAGVPSVASKWTRDEVIGELRALHAAGKYMSSLQLRTEHNALVSGASRLFGGWGNALKASGIPAVIHPTRMNKRRHWTEPLILDRLRELDRAGEDLRDRTAKTRYMPLYHAAREHFGTYINAVAQAGIDYDRAVQRALQKQRRQVRAL